MTTTTRTLCSALATLTLAPLCAAQLTTGGDVLLLSTPPASVLPGDLAVANTISVFQEQSGLSLPTTLTVDIDTPGSYTNGLGGMGGGTVPAGTLVDVYLFHQDSGGVPDDNSGFVEFPEDVLGILVTTPGLRGSDTTYGSSTTLYPMTGSENNGRGMEFLRDDLFFDSSRRRIDVNFTTDNKMDQIRIFVRATDSDPFDPFCFGQSGCPCGNDVGAGVERGCANSTGTGARLVAGGSNDIAADDLTLRISDLPAGSSMLLFMGNMRPAPMLLGDGLLCVSPGPLGSPVGQGYLRFPVRRASSSGDVVYSNVVSFANANLGGGSGLILPGVSWSFQAIYRDPAANCTGAGFNQSSAVRVDF